MKDLVAATTWFLMPPGEKKLTSQAEEEETVRVWFHNAVSLPRTKNKPFAMLVNRFEGSLLQICFATRSVQELSVLVANLPATTESTPVQQLVAVIERVESLRARGVDQDDLAGAVAAIAEHRAVICELFKARFGENADIAAAKRVLEHFTPCLPKALQQAFHACFTLAEAMMECKSYRRCAPEEGHDTWAAFPVSEGLVSAAIKFIAARSRPPYALEAEEAGTVPNDPTVTAIWEPLMRESMPLFASLDAWLVCVRDSCLKPPMPEEGKIDADTAFALHQKWLHRVQAVLDAKLYQLPPLDMPQVALESILEEGRFVSKYWFLAATPKERVGPQGCKVQEAVAILARLGKSPMQCHPTAFSKMDLLQFLVDHIKGKFAARGDAADSIEVLELLSGHPLYEGCLKTLVAEHQVAFEGRVEALQLSHAPWWEKVEKWGNLEEATSDMNSSGSGFGMADCKFVAGLLRQFDLAHETEKATKSAQLLADITRDSAFAASWPGYPPRVLETMRRRLTEVQARCNDYKDMVCVFERLTPTLAAGTGVEAPQLEDLVRVSAAIKDEFWIKFVRAAAAAAAQARDQPPPAPAAPAPAAQAAAAGAAPPPTTAAPAAPAAEARELAPAPAAAEAAPVLAPAAAPTAAAPAAEAHQLAPAPAAEAAPPARAPAAAEAAPEAEAEAGEKRPAAPAALAAAPTTAAAGRGRGRGRGDQAAKRPRKS
ncbi:MAG: hypothetical protein GY772_30940 [bacterium]|nr:hypothetical protein [bacterium]